MTLEKLLNILCEKGWKPFEDDKIHSFEIIYVTWKILNIVAKRWRWQVNKHYSIRDICSKSSWLWQFVCENGMINRWHYVWDWWIDNRYDKWIWDTDYKFWIIESALCDEDKLEEFLLDNIKIDVE